MVNDEGVKSDALGGNHRLAQHRPDEGREARGLEDQCAAGSASTPAVLISPHARLTDAAELMTRHGVTHLVVAEARRPVGVLSTLDVAVAIADSAPG